MCECARARLHQLTRAKWITPCEVNEHCANVSKNDHKLPGKMNLISFAVGRILTGIGGAKWFSRSHGAYLSKKLWVPMARYGPVTVACLRLRCAKKRAAWTEQSKVHNFLWSEQNTIAHQIQSLKTLDFFIMNYFQQNSKLVSFSSGKQKWNICGAFFSPTL